MRSERPARAPADAGSLAAGRQARPQRLAFDTQLTCPAVVRFGRGRVQDFQECSSVVQTGP